VNARLCAILTPSAGTVMVYECIVPMMRPSAADDAARAARRSDDGEREGTTAGARRLKSKATDIRLERSIGAVRFSIDIATVSANVRR
jgi:hypothetical protein